MEQTAGRVERQGQPDIERPVTVRSRSAMRCEDMRDANEQRLVRFRMDTVGSTRAASNLTVRPDPPRGLPHQTSGRELNRLVYVGQTGRSLRERLMSLARGANADECPYNDPHTAAPHLWLLQRLDGARFEFSCAAVGGNAQLLRGTEDMLLWQHRVQSGSSTIANYGRFYPGYARATNRWIARRSGGRAPGHRAVPCTDDLARDDFTGSHPVLQCEASILQALWWQRIRLSEALSLPCTASTIKGPKSRSTSVKPPSCARGP
jgi:hypothetical protein